METNFLLSKVVRAGQKGSHFQGGRFVWLWRKDVRNAGSRNFFPDEQTVSDRGVRSEGEREK